MPGGFNYFAGELDEVAMWHRALSSTEIATLYGGGVGYYITTSSGPGTSGLTALWHFDEGTGTTTSDATTNGHTGTLKGGPLPTWVAGR